MKILSVEQCESRSIHDICSNNYDRQIKFPKNSCYAVVLASYYGGRGYTTHKTSEATIRRYNELGDWSKIIIDCEGNEYSINGDNLEIV